MNVFLFDNAFVSDRTQEDLALKDKIEKAKDKRLRKEKLTGVALSIAENEDESALLSAADWVKRSRQKALEPKSAVVESKSAMIQQQSNLNSLQVKHGADDFEIGESIILTLADAPLLEKDGRKIVGLNDTDDLLENINFAEDDRRQDREKRKKRLRQPVYSAYDDEEFGTNGKKRNILSQYDEEEKSGPKLVISSDGQVLDAVTRMPLSDPQPSSSGAAELRAEDILAEASKQSKSQVMSDFYSPEEYASFAKVKFKSKEKDKKKKTTRKKDDDVAGDDSYASNLILEHQRRMEQLDAMDEEDGDMDKKFNSNTLSGASADTGSRDHGSRNQASNKLSSINEAQLAAAKKKDMYETAVRMAENKTQSHPSFRRGIAGIDTDPIEAGDAELQRSLARVKRIESTLPSLHEQGIHTVSIEDRGARAVQETLSRLNANQPKKVEITSDEFKFDEVDADGRRADGSLVFSSTTEFSTRLQARMNENARSKAEAAVRAASVATHAKSVIPSQVVDSNGQWATISGNTPATDLMDVVVPDSGKVDDSVQVNGNDDDDNMYDEAAEEEEEEDDEQMGFLHRQPIVARGMAATLALLKGSGELAPKDELVGRAKDQRALDPSSHDFGVNIEYRDEAGRKLTQKEAFRQLSYRFHGYGPGKKKLEKRQKALEDQTKAASARVAVGGAGTLKSLVQTQEATGKAHVVVQGGHSSSQLSAAELAVVKQRVKAKAEKSGGASTVFSNK